MSLGKLNFGAPDWILGGWVVLQKKVCNHNYTTPANEQGPAIWLNFRDRPHPKSIPARKPARVLIGYVRRDYGIFDPARAVAPPPALNALISPFARAMLAEHY